MFYHIITHTECNLSCKYCDREEFETPNETYDYSVPKRITYNLNALKEFITEEDYITFYGGEPLLAIEDVKQIMDNISCKGFMIQTNGLLLNKLEKKYLSRFHTILLSIDGDKTVTDKNRGTGVHEKVLKNIELLKQSFTGELIARMTITKGSSLYKQVHWLQNNGFENIHWQIDGMFYEDSPFDWYEEYNKEVSRLIEEWVEEMHNGKVHRLYPFLAIMDSMLKNEKAEMRCGAGITNFTITTQGNIAPCPIMGSMKKYYCGDIFTKKITPLKVHEPCTSCNILNICGGRCLYTNLTQLGSKEAYTALCNTVRHLVNELQRVQLEIENLIKEGTIKKESFTHLKYNGVEVIP